MSLATPSFQGCLGGTNEPREFSFQPPPPPTVLFSPDRLQSSPQVSVFIDPIPVQRLTIWRYRFPFALKKVPVSLAIKSESNGGKKYREKKTQQGPLHHRDGII